MVHVARSVPYPKPNASSAPDGSGPEYFDLEFVLAALLRQAKVISAASWPAWSSALCT